VFPRDWKRYNNRSLPTESFGMNQNFIILSASVLDLWQTKKLLLFVLRIAYIILPHVSYILLDWSSDWSLDNQTVDATAPSEYITVQGVGSGLLMVKALT